jgi:hypothetical protein
MVSHITISMVSLPVSTLSYRGSSPVPTQQRAAERVDGWIAGTSPAMTTTYRASRMICPTAVEDAGTW